MSSYNNNMFGYENNGKSNEQVIKEMKEQSEETGRPVITELSKKVTVYDFSEREDTGSGPVKASSNEGRIGDIEARVNHYMAQGMDVTEAARSAYEDVNSAYKNEVANLDEIQNAVQELEAYVEDKGGDLEAVSEVLDSKIEQALGRTDDAARRIDDVYQDLLG